MVHEFSIRVFLPRKLGEMNRSLEHQEDADAPFNSSGEGEEERAARFGPLASKRVAGVEFTTGGPESAVSNSRGPPSPPPPWETTKYGMFSVNGCDISP